MSLQTEEVVGVDRTPEVPPGTEFSRFHIPLETPRKGAPLPREGSRAAVTPEEKGEAAHSEDTATDEDYVLARLPNAESELPYDDEKFAEMLLQMEVEGAIDEAWQDSRRAHLEDVVELTEVLKEMRVRDICCIDVSSKTANFDYIMFGTCEGPRHIHLAAWAAQEADALKRIAKIPRKKTDEQWEVVPIGRIVLNLLQEGMREELSLERKWAVTSSMDPLNTANAAVSEGRQVRSHGLWTLTLNLQDLEDFEVDYCKDILLRQV
ncbi:hypothetical protein AGDE_02236 [Angomonas deanei]|nr:hypothetical protein AGDE_08303 [Angomonas deanei]EPY41688.1 hypothetical protein AGDE_02236 [Angomonas deanei]|eukprot:EPY33398.1 hypothetical protein AGDE_08303 [Angomonas deanei]